MSSEPTRRTGDTVSIPGDYQYRVSREGLAPQRFWHQHRFMTCASMLDASAGHRVLDIGCGSGVFANMVAEREGVHVLGVDRNADAVTFASSHFDNPRLKFQHGLVDELSFEPGTFDRISLLEVIEHIYPAQASALVRGCHALLKPGGRLVISTPNRRSLWPVPRVDCGSPATGAHHGRRAARSRLRRRHVARARGGGRVPAARGSPSVRPVALGYTAELVPRRAPARAGTATPRSARRAARAVL